MQGIDKLRMFMAISFAASQTPIEITEPVRYEIKPRPDDKRIEGFKYRPGDKPHQSWKPPRKGMR